jgi:hypothetical protein
MTRQEENPQRANLKQGQRIAGIREMSKYLGMSDKINAPGPQRLLINRGRRHRIDIAA